MMYRGTLKEAQECKDSQILSVRPDTVPGLSSRRYVLGYQYTRTIG